MLVFFEKIPEDIILHVLGFLNPEDLQSFQKVSKAFKKLSLNNKLWQQLFKKHFGVQIKIDDQCREKFIIHYLFEKEKNSTFGAGGYKNKFLRTHREKLEEFSEDQTDNIWTSYILGEIFFHGYGTKKKGLDYLKQAADLGNVNAMFLFAKKCLDMPFYTLISAPQKEAIFLLNKAIEHGHHEAVYLLASYYFEKKEPGKGIEILGKSALTGNGEAAFRLSNIYSLQIGVIEQWEETHGPLEYEEDVEEEITEDLAFEESEIDPRYLKLKNIFLKNCSQMGLEELVRLYDKYSDLSESYPSIFKKIRLELIKNRYYLADKIYYWLKEASDSGIKEAALDMGLSYLFGHHPQQKTIFCSKDVAKGLHYLKGAALLKSGQASYILGCLCAIDNPDELIKDEAKALGVTIDVAEAIKWFWNGTEGDSGKYLYKCIAMLIEIYKSKEFGVGPDLGKVLFLYNKGSELGSKKFLLAFGKLCLSGDAILGLKPDFEKANELFEKLFHGHDNDGRFSQIIANEYLSHQCVENYIKWNIRGVMRRNEDCAFALHDVFRDSQCKNNAKLFMDVKNKGLSNRWEQIGYTLIKDSCIPNMDSDSGDENASKKAHLSLEEFLELVRDTYHHLGFNFIEADFTTSSDSFLFLSIPGEKNAKC